MTHLSKDSTKIKCEQSYFRLVKASVSVIFIFLTAGCVVNPDEDNSPFSPKNESGQENLSETEESREDEAAPIASSLSSSTTLGSDLQVDIHALESVNQETLRLSLEVINHSGESYLLYDALGDEENTFSASGITLIDSVNQTRHLSYTQNDGSCFCSTLDESIRSGESAPLWVMFPKPPTEVQSMTVITPITAPFFDIPITDSEETIENQGLADGEIIPLTMISDDLEDQTGRSESDDEISIILSSDVLFDTNSAALNPETHEILEQVATEIDGAKSTVVEVDGYADNTGNDSFNIPLSEDRAEAVEGVLLDLTKREGISFNTEGHGSADPIAGNDTEEGRKRNRRVTVTFER